MRRAFFIVASLTLLVTGVAWAEDTVAAGPAPEARTEAGGLCDETSFAAQLRGETAEDLDEIQTIEPAPTEMGGVPLNCPTTSNCVGGAGRCNVNPAHCSPTGSSSSIDFGGSSCVLPSGSLFKCKGGRTVHLIITQCEQCPCCSTTPACFCPLDCGEARTLACL